MHIIAEAGSNHGGEVEKAKKLVDVAARCKADSIKFQFIFPEGLYLQSYLQDDGSHQASQVFEQRSREALDDEGWEEVWAHAEGVGISISASVFCERGLNLLERLGAPYVKIASTDLTNHKLISQAAERFKTVVLSTGMASVDEVRRTIEETASSLRSTELVLMHCVSRYPCPTEDANLGRLQLLRDISPCVGYSDHTQGSDSAIAALACGVEIFEKHFTLDKGAPGFDNLYAENESELHNYIDTLSKVSAALKSNPTAMTEEELNTRLRARRGLYLARDVRAGELIKDSDLLYVRPSSNSAGIDQFFLGGEWRASEDLAKHQAVSIRLGEVLRAESNSSFAEKYWAKEMKEKKLIS